MIMFQCYAKLASFWIGAYKDCNVKVVNVALGLGKTSRCMWIVERMGLVTQFSNITITEVKSFTRPVCKIDHFGKYLDIKQWLIKRNSFTGYWNPSPDIALSDTSKVCSQISLQMNSSYHNLDREHEQMEFRRIIISLCCTKCSQRITFKYSKYYPWDLMMKIA